MPGLEEQIKATADALRRLRPMFPRCPEYDLFASHAFEAEAALGDLLDGSTRSAAGCAASWYAALDAAPAFWRELWSRWFALSLGDPEGNETVARRMLAGLADVTPSPDRLEALWHVVTRPPEHGDRPRWEVVLANSGPERFARWLNVNVRLEADTRRARREQHDQLPEMPEEAAARLAEPEPEEGSILLAALDAERDSARLLALIASAGLTPAETDLVLRVARGEADTLADAARQRGRAPATARKQAEAIRKKLPAAALRALLSA